VRVIVDAVKFDLDVDQGIGHSPYFCEMSKFSNTEIKISCNANAPLSDWESGEVVFPSIAITRGNKITIPTPRDDFGFKYGDWITILEVNPGMVKLLQFDGFIDMADAVREDGHSIEGDHIEWYIDDVKDILEHFVKEQFKKSL